MNKRICTVLLCLCLLVGALASCSLSRNAFSVIRGEETLAVEYRPNETMDPSFVEGGRPVDTSSGGENETNPIGTPETGIPFPFVTGSGEETGEEPETGLSEQAKEEFRRLAEMIMTPYDLPIGGWATPHTNLRDGKSGVAGSYDAAFQLLADAGINFMITLEEWSSPSWCMESLSSAHKAGIKLWYNCAGQGADYSLDRIRAMLASVDGEALGAIYVKDEPSMAELAALANTTQAIRDGLGENIEIPVFSNLLPTYASASAVSSSYRSYVQSYVNTVHPDILMFDYYPYQGTQGNRLADMIANIGIAQEVAGEADIELYTYIQSSGSGTALREPTLEELRLNVNLNLAMGARGLAYFLLCEHYEDWSYTSMIDAKGQPTAMYDKIKSVNQEILGMKGMYLEYNFAGVMFANYAQGSRALTQAGCDLEMESFGHLAEVETAANGKAMIGCFRDESEAYDGYYVVNLDAEKSTEVTLHMNDKVSFFVWGSEGCERFDEGTSLTLSLEPGEGVFVMQSIAVTG